MKNLGLALIVCGLLLGGCNTAPNDPTVAARAYAIVHTCVFDAWAAYDRVAQGTRLGDGLRRPPDDGTAAHRVVEFLAAKKVI